MKPGTIVSFDVAKSMLPEGEKVHTFVGMMIGADWDRAALLETIEANTARIAGPFAQAMGHGLVVHRPGRQPLFVATREEE